MDVNEQQILMQRQEIMQSLDAIYGYLVQGSQIETSVAGLLFLAYDTLKHYWLGIPTPSPPEKIIKRIDKIEAFIERCAELD